MKKILFYGIALGLIALSACRRNHDELTGGAQSTEDNALAQEVYDDVFKLIDEDAQQKPELRGPACATVTWTFTPVDTFPATMTIDFGTTGCAGINDPRIRTGKIIVTFSGRYRTPSTVMNVSFDNYTVNGYGVEGTKTITNNGRNTAGNLSYTVQVTNGKITAPDGTFFTYNSTRTREWIEGEATTFLTDGLLGVQDDVYLVTGNASGVNRNGNAFTAEITTPLRRELSCRWFVSGVCEFTPANLQTRVIDFGNGNCDNQATLSVGNYSTSITLH